MASYKQMTQYGRQDSMTHSLSIYLYYQILAILGRREALCGSPAGSKTNY